MYVPRNLYISISNFTKESKVTSISSLFYSSCILWANGLFLHDANRIKVGCMRAHSSVIPQWRHYDATDVTIA